MMTFDVVVINTHNYSFKRKYKKVEKVDDALDLCASIEADEHEIVCIVPRNQENVTVSNLSELKRKYEDN